MSSFRIKSAASILRALIILLFIWNSYSFGLASEAVPQATCSASHQDVATPLNDLGPGEYIRMDGTHTGFSGGLYPSGSNMRPAAHEAAGLVQASRVTARDASGAPEPGGKIVMVSVGMSNTRQEFATFIELAYDDPQVNPQLVLVNGALPSQTSETWVDPNAPTWQQLFSFLSNAGVTPQQVQAAWIKQTRTGGGDFPAKAQTVEADLQAIVRNLKTHFPNIQIAYLSSRTHSYTFWNGLSPEPVAFENGFAVKWLVENQINGDPALNYDPGRGDVVAPYLSWGAYLWADGENPRSDGLVWLQEDLAEDCTHPSDSGQQKAGQLLLDFFKSDSTTASWFLEDNPLPSPTPTPTPTVTPPPPVTDFALFMPLAVDQSQ